MVEHFLTIGNHIEETKNAIEDMKLSLYSQRVRNGARNEDVFNPDEMRRKLFDVKIEGVLKLSPQNKDMLCMLSVNSMGCLVFLIKPLFSRMGDYRSLVLAVPRQIVFSSAKDIPSIVDDMRRILAEEKDDGAQDRWAPLAKWFDKDYAETDFTWPLAAGGERYAYRVCGKGVKAGALAGFLGTAMLQDYYADYEGVFLLDQGQESLVRENAMADISQKTIVKPAIVRPPKRLPKDVRLFSGKMEMTSPVLSHIGTTMRLALRKDQCQDLPVSHKVTEEDSVVQVPAQMEWLRKIPMSVLLLVDEEDKQIRSSNGRVDIAEAAQGTNKNYILIPEAFMRKAHVAVTIDGFERNTFEIDFTKVSKEHPYRAMMRKVRSKVRYKVGGDIAFDMERTDDHVAESPLPGYDVADVKGNVVTLKRIGEKTGKASGKKDKKWNLYRIAVGLVAGLLIGFAAGWFPGVNYGVNTRNEELEKERLAQQQAEQQRADSLERMKMVAYIDSVPSWKKESFDTIFGGKLSALYRNVNYFNFDDVQQLVEDLQLEDSKQMKMLDSVIGVMNSNADYITQLQESTKNEDENHQKFFSADGSITLTNLFKHLEAARKAVDEKKKP